MHLRLLFLLLSILVSSLSWGQNRLIQDKLARAEEIKTKQGICSDYIGALLEASNVAMNEGDMVTATKIYEDLLSATSKVYPDDADLLFSCQSMLALLYNEAKNYEKALPLLKQCYQATKGQDFTMDSEYLESIIIADLALKKYDEAIRYRKEKCDLILKTQGRDAEYANNLYKLSSIYRDVSNEKEAIRVLQECLELLEPVKEQNYPLYDNAKYYYQLLTTGETSIISESAIINHWGELMDRYIDTNDEQFILDAIAYLEDKDFVPNIDTLRKRTLQRLSMHYYVADNYRQSILTILDEPFMESFDWFLLGRSMESMGDFVNAREDYKYAMAFAFQEKNDVSDTFFTYFDLYARACIQTGQYQEIFGMLEQFYENEATIPGWELRPALYMSMLAELKYSINDYRGAIECVNKCAPVFLKSSLFEDYQTNIWLAIACYEQLGDYTACVELLQQLSSAYKSNPNYEEDEATTDIALAVYLLQSGQKELASETVSSILSRFSSHMFSDFWVESSYHIALGHYYQASGDNQKAENEFKTGIAILKENAPENDSNYPQDLAALANLYLQWPGNEPKALPTYEEAFRLIKKYHDESFAPYFLYYLGVIFSKYHNELPVSETELTDFINTERIQSQALLFQMSESERAAFWRNHNDTKDLIFSLAGHGVKASTLYDYALLYKGILLSSSTQVGRIVNSAKDATLSELFGRLSVMSQDKDNIDDSLDKIRRLEHQVLARCQELGHAINPTVTSADVESALDDNDVAIEFVDYKQLEIVSNPSVVNKYAALVMRKGWPEPKLVDLGNESALSDIIQSKDKAYDNLTLYNLIWKPLEQYIPAGSKVYYSPAGLLHQVAIEAIPYSKGKILCDRYSFARLSSTRELILQGNNENPYSSSAIYGGLQYSLSDDELVTNSQRYAYRATPVSADYLSRGGDTASPWRFLPGTRAEAESIAALLTTKGVTPALYMGAEGNEESFKALSGQSPSILHIATHGFYLKNQDFTTSTTESVDMRGQLQAQKSALKRSGLIMAGANPAWTEGKLLPNVEDGVLTAEEISSLDLRNTTLAIISACDSGLGEINNDGVEGLQRAFKSAGVQTLVVTLWKVDDSATELMMTEFYKNLTSGQSRRDAFDSARATVRAKYPEPYYWAPFVMID